MKHYSKCPFCAKVINLADCKPGSMKNGLRCVSCNKKFDAHKQMLSAEDALRHQQLEKKLSAVVKRVDLKLDDGEESFNKNIELLEKTSSKKLSGMKKDVQQVVEELDGLVEEKFFKQDKHDIDYIKSAQGKHKQFKETLHEKNNELNNKQAENKENLKNKKTLKNKKKGSEFKFLLLDDDAYEKRNKSRTKFSILSAISVFFGLLICVVLSALFLFQLYLRNQAEWHNSQSLRPIVEKVAAVMGETIAEKRDVKQIHLVSTSMLPHPKIENAVIVQVQLINKAKFSQFFPWFEVSITDVGGKVLARRNVGPRDYLLAGQQQQKIKSKEFKKINIQMLALPKTADGYEIRLLNK